MDHEVGLLEVAAARADFLSSGRVPASGIEEIIVASWLRSSASGVDATGTSFTYTEDIDIQSRLVRCAQPVIDRLESELSGLPLSLVLTDNRARILCRRDNDARLGVLLDRISMIPGFGYEEDRQGTNGIGTAIESGHAVLVIGPEHFHERFQTFACAGAPIRDPLTGTIEGVLDLTCLRDQSSRLMTAVARSAALNIEHQLFDDRNVRQKALFDAFVRRGHRSRQPRFAISSSLVIADSVAHALLTAEEHRIIRAHAAFRGDTRKQIDETIELTPGKYVRIRTDPVTLNGENIGVVMEVTPLAETLTPRVPGPGSGTTGHGVTSGRGVATGHGVGRAGGEGRQTPDRSCLAVPTLRRAAGALPTVRMSASPTLQRVLRSTAAAMQPGRAVLVTGEPGTGKLFLLKEVFGDMYRDGAIAITLAQDLDAPPGKAVDIELMVGAVGDRPLLFVIRQLEDLPEQSALRVGEYVERLRALRPNIMVAGTLRLDRGTSEEVPGALLSSFDESICIPGLRHRSEDIPALAAAIVSNVAAPRKLQLTADAIRQLMRYQWPRNVAELEEVVRFAVSQRPAGEIRLQDLPAACFHAARRTLSAIEASERDTILAALHDVGGNRSRAATRLGISRSSLYRKLDAYGIEFGRS